jgi:hypothetical protein
MYLTNRVVFGISYLDEHADTINSWLKNNFN